LSHYFNLVNGESIALYNRSKVFRISYSADTSVEDLWALHKIAKIQFEKLLISNSEVDEIPQQTFLDLKIDLADKLLENCEFCENKCKVNRKLGHKGFCGMEKEAFLSSRFLHMGEEAPLIPSGTLFFAGCTMDCQFCQNHDISSVGKTMSLKFAGKSFSHKYLGKVTDRLVAKGALNVNYVGGDPTPSLHAILASMKFQTHNTCQLWNSNLYNSLPALELLSDVIDLWLPDFKYGNNDCGLRLSKVNNYWDVLTRNLKYISQHGTGNIIIRHLVMPGHLECCTKPILTWISKHIPVVPVNIMGQYRPAHKILSNSKQFPELGRRLSREELLEAYFFAEKLGLEFKSLS